MIDALAYLHERRHVHGKLNASNLLLTISNDILLADPYIEGLPCAQKRRALLASPPEAFNSWDSYPCLTPSSDIWSVGCVLVTMVTRYPPFLDHFMHFHGDGLHRVSDPLNNFEGAVDGPKVTHIYNGCVDHD